MKTESISDLSKKEINKRAKLTSAEQDAVDNLIAAAKALPPSICISTPSFTPDPGEPSLEISKRITHGSCQRVAYVRKKSLIF